MTQFKEFDGKWALILGASSGFGAATSLALAEAGLNIFGVHLDRKATMKNVEDLQEKIQKLGRKCQFFNVNAADAEARAQVVEEMKKVASGKVHVMLHSLAFGNLKPFIGEDPVSEAAMAMTINVMGSSLVFWAQDVHKNNLFAKGGRIYAMTSSGSSRVWKSYGPVSAAKSALESNCRQLALELAPDGITANAILAGVTDTPALRKIPGNDTMIEMAKKRNPFGRLTTTEDVARALVAFSLPYCDFMTGNTLRIDGGENIVD